MFQNAATQSFLRETGKTIRHADFQLHKTSYFPPKAALMRAIHGIIKKILHFFLTLYQVYPL